MEQVFRKAYAKINLGLDVLRRREDGYHELKMIMQTVEICDDLLFVRTKKPGIALRIDREELPADGDNLICRAAELLFRERGIRDGVSVTLTKRIPIAAGMAGGSADAAAAMKGICRLYDLDTSLSGLMELGMTLGADVPYCVLGGTALAEGIGEKLTPLTPAPDFFIVGAKPDISVSTKYVYEHLDAAGIQKHPDIDGMVLSIESGSLQGILDRMGNVLESVTVPAHPVIDTLKRRLRELGAVNSLMSGSGPTVFGIFLSERMAEFACEQLKSEPSAKQVFLTTPT